MADTRITPTGDIRVTTAGDTRVAISSGGVTTTAGPLVGGAVIKSLVNSGLVN